MGLNNFRPELWTPRILRAFDKAFVFGKCANKNYEGEIREKGDSVRINQIGPISVENYGSTGIGTPGQLTDASLTLQVDQAKDFKFRLEDIDKAQGTPGIMGEAMRKSGVAVANAVDKHLALNYQFEGASTETGKGTAAAALKVYTTSVANAIIQIGEILDTKNVPADGRWMIVPPWWMSRLLKSDVYTGGTGALLLDNPNSAALASGKVGHSLGFDFYMSNNVSKATTHYRVMAGTNDAITFAGQITKVEAYRPEQYFADAVRGLYVYGSKVVNPDALVTVYCAAK